MRNIIFFNQVLKDQNNFKMNLTKPQFILQIIIIISSANYISGIIWMYFIPRLSSAIRSPPSIEKIKMSPGDRIKCTQKLVFHHMLAVTDDEVVHMIGDGNSGDIRKSNRQDVMELGLGKNCDNLGHKGPLTREESVKKALNDVGLVTYYSLLRCNCEHWVNYWMTGKSGISWQSFMPTNSKCAI